MMIVHYASKKELKAAIGEPLKYSETSMSGPEYLADGTLTVARRPHLQGGGREFFARVTMASKNSKNGTTRKWAGLEASRSFLRRII